MCKFTIFTFQFIQKFPTDELAREFLEKRRWPNSAVCPKCQRNKGITPRKGKQVGYYHCGTCNYDFTVRTGAVYERSHIGLQKWLYGHVSYSNSAQGRIIFADWQGIRHYAKIGMVYATPLTGSVQK
ncbi:MAG: transposase [Candidatus Zeuxoniibacter abyssi]|nr:MAG: transposase [Candidatus Persebacteraceae bacterium AB1(2)]